MYFWKLLLVYSLFELGACELWCYSCVSTHPGCEEFYVDWRIHHAITCPKSDDKCVKIIEKKGAETFITRDCLSNLKGQRKDIPADRYDGCRPAAPHPKLAVYVENHISQLEILKAHYDDVSYCFCEFDQWCNDAVNITFRKSCLLIGVVVLILISDFLR